jgi:transposase
VVHGMQQRKNYPADLTDEHWALVAPLLPPATQSLRGGRPRTVGHARGTPYVVLSQPEWRPRG